MEIAFNDTVGKYQLILPQSLTDELGLTSAGDKPLEIFHESHYNLEWLHKDLEQRQTERKEMLLRGAHRRKRKLRFWGIVFLLALLAIPFSGKIAAQGNTPVSIIRMIAIVIAVMSGMMLLQTFFLNGLSPKDALMDNVKTIELRELIEEKYSK